MFIPIDELTPLPVIYTKEIILKIQSKKNKMIYRKTFITALVKTENKMIS